jgi:hypothetical protein
LERIDLRSAPKHRTPPRCVPKSTATIRSSQLDASGLEYSRSAPLRSRLAGRLKRFRDSSDPGPWRYGSWAALRRLVPSGGHRAGRARLRTCKAHGKKCALGWTGLAVQGRGCRDSCYSKRILSTSLSRGVWQWTHRLGWWRAAGPAAASGADLLLGEPSSMVKRAPRGPCFCHRILRICVRNVKNVCQGRDVSRARYRVLTQRRFLGRQGRPVRVSVTNR